MRKGFRNGLQLAVWAAVRPSPRNALQLAGGAGGGTAVSCVLVGTRNTAELAQNIEGVNVAMPPDLVKKLDRLTLPLLQKLGGNADYFWATRTK